MRSNPASLSVSVRHYFSGGSKSCRMKEKSRVRLTGRWPKNQCMKRDQFGRPCMSGNSFLPSSRNSPVRDRESRVDLVQPSSLFKTAFYRRRFSSMSLGLRFVTPAAIALVQIALACVTTTQGGTAEPSATAGHDLYHFLRELPIGGEGGWDILTIDSAANRMYLAHATKVVVIDLNKSVVAGEISDTPGVHAFLAVPELQRGFSSNGKESKSSVVDLTTLKTISKIDTAQNPDAIVYEPRHHDVYLFNHTGNSATVINAKSATVTATIPL